MMTIPETIVAWAQIILSLVALGVLAVVAIDMIRERRR